MKYIILGLILGLGSLHALSLEVIGQDLRTNKIYKKLKIDRPLVAYFLSSTCPCSQAHFDHLNKLQKQYSQFDFIAFHSSKTVSEQKAKKYFAQFQINFPILMDKGLRYANALKALKTPHIFVLDKDDNVLFQGGATNSRNPKKATKFYLKNALASIEQGKEIEIKNAKTLGCYIQR